ncbi:MAG: hypothetical protein QOI12_431 [Alphaproteobacteria bacterium]|jgi:hypothetical protein|nr:hypothetical protein [Alphaproteobacteria bacterium]
MWWLAYQTPDDVCVVVMTAPSLVHARMAVALGGQEGEFSEGHQLDEKMAKRIPKKMIGRQLSSGEAARLL